MAVTPDCPGRPSPPPSRPPPAVDTWPPTRALGPLGFKRKGRSRIWLADRGWWLLVIEFQPSSSRRGATYLNVGEQHLWIECDHLVFEEHERPLGGTAVVDLSMPGSVEEVVAVASKAGL